MIIDKSYRIGNSIEEKEFTDFKRKENELLAEELVIERKKLEKLEDTDSQKKDTIKFMDTGIDIIRGDGAIIKDVNKNGELIKKLLNKLVVPSKNIKERIATQHLFDNVTKKIIKLPKMNLPELLNLIYKFKLEAGKSFYGALIRSSKKEKFIMNPLHIISAISIIKQYDNLKNMEFYGMIYLYEDREAMDVIFSSDEYDESKGKENIESLMVLANETSYVRREEKDENKLLESQIRDDAFNNHIDIIKLFEGEQKEKENEIYKMIPNQILTKSVISPFYGTSLVAIIENGWADGTFLSPVRCCNISSSSWEEDNPSFGSVCTGQSSNMTEEGWRTLTHSNMGSPYGSANNIFSGSLRFIDDMIDLSIKMYKSSEIIKEEYEKKEGRENEQNSEDNQ